MSACSLAGTIALTSASRGWFQPLVIGATRRSCSVVANAVLAVPDDGITDEGGCGDGQMEASVERDCAAQGARGEGAGVIRLLTVGVEETMKRERGSSKSDQRGM